jgi:hypothetical protein
MRRGTACVEKTELVPKTLFKLPAFPLPPGLLFYAPPPVLRQAIVSDFPPVAPFSECMSFYNPAKHLVSIHQAAEQRAAFGLPGGPSLRRLLRLNGLHQSACASFIRIHPDCTQVMVGPTVTVMAVAAANQVVRMRETTPASSTVPAAFMFARRRRHPSQFHLRDAARRCLTA